MSDNSQLFWGAAISAAQTESACDVDGKGLSIWDEFCSKKQGYIYKQSTIKNKDHMKDSCDFYYHYKEDILLLKKIGFKHFRFSIAWTRVMPDGINVNPLGVDFYKDVIDFCHENEIVPWVTLYHWDLPIELEKKGGWINREIIEWFTQYATFCVKTFSTVENWILINEPSVFLGAGYLFGIHAPGKKSFDGFLAATHHVMLSIGEAYRRLKNEFPDKSIGSSFSFTHIEPAGHKEKDYKAAELADKLVNRMFFEPLIGHGYPLGDVKKLNQITKFFKKGDEEKLITDLDFYGLQTYTREVFKHNPFNPFLKLKHVPADERTIDLTAMNWEMHAESIYKTIMKVHAYNLNRPIVVTENGAAFNDQVVLDRVNDFSRIHYFQTHINEVLRAKSDGADVKGYFAWSLLDNFEWAEGYYPRFGLIYVDFKTKKRLMKESAHWFRRFLSSQLKY
ncbi:MAG: family 1 glycosylhydrolase [Bacteroidia bacterium]|nr:family 1 glycosylhydrolase [Bacteroidia bacterium]